MDQKNTLPTKEITDNTHEASKQSGDKVRAQQDPLYDFFAENDEAIEVDIEKQDETIFGEALLSGQRQFDSDIREYLHFTLGTEHYAIELGRINEIIKVRQITPVPRTEEHVAGIISLRGNIVPLYKLSKILSLDLEEHESSLVLVVQGIDEGEIGLMVTRIRNVVRVSEKAIEPPPATLAEEGRDFIFGIGRADDTMIILLDLDAIVGGEEHDSDN